MSHNLHQQIILYLEKKGIEYRDHDPFININNPFTDDRKFRLGINVEEKFYHCFKTSESGSIFSLISKLDNITEQDAKELLKYKYDSIEDLKIKYRNKVKRKKREKQSFEVLELPPHTLELDDSISCRKFTKFLKNKIKDESCLKNKKFFYCYDGKWAGFLILPYYYNNSIRYYIGRNTNPMSEMRYKYPEAQEVMKYKSDYIYNYDLCDTHTLYICEGAFNALVVNGIAIGGSSASDTQIESIVSLKPEKIVVCLDQDTAGKKGTKKICLDLLNYVNNVSFYSLPKKVEWDFADIGKNKSIQLIEKYTFKANVECFLKYLF